MFELPSPTDDELLIPTVGKWSREKHHFLRRYVDAFTVAMRDKFELHYVDLFAGAGIERIECDSSLEWGSPLIAAHAGFSKLHLCELDPSKLAALLVRIRRARPGKDDEILCADANVGVSTIIASIPEQGTLTLAFLDPFGLHIAFETLRALSRRRSDLIIFFPDRLDIERNWEKYYWSNPASNLDSVLGPNCDWRTEILTTPVAQRREKFRSLYLDQIRCLGYRYFELEGIPNQSRLYWLIFCSANERGAKIWRNVAEKKPDGQRTLLFPEPD